MRAKLALAGLGLVALVAIGVAVSQGDPADVDPPEAAPPSATVPTVVPREPTNVRILMVGDLMIGRRVGELAVSDPYGVFEDAKYVVGDADLALANLESPLTTLPHTSDNPYELEADPALAQLIAATGFDVLGIANNHAGDAGPESVIETIEAVERVGMTPLGGGTDLATAWEPAIVELHGVRIAMLAIDVSRQGLAATADAGVASWDPVMAEDVVRNARGSADVVVVAIHGGIDGWTGTDPVLEPVGRQLVAWGADVVWGHGPHVAQPIIAVDAPDGRRAVVATSLGNFLFDQQVPPNTDGRVLEVTVDEDGLVAWRVGRTRSDDLRAHFTEWLLPEGAAALLDGQWWALAEPVASATSGSLELDFPYGDVIAATGGDLTGDGERELLVAYRHPLRPSASDPRPLPVDESGRSAHVGVFDLDVTPLWMSRRPPAPVGVVCACDGAAAFGYTTLESDAIVATQAGVWNGFGFTMPPQLPGPGTPGCVDVDGDGLLDAVILGRG